MLARELALTSAKPDAAADPCKPAWAYGDLVHDHKTQHRLSRDEAAVVDAVLADPICRTIVDRAPQLGLTEWWLTAGCRIGICQGE